MNGRAIAAEIAGLAAGALWVFAGTALVVSAYDDGASVSFGAAAAVVGLSYGLTRLLRDSNVSEGAARLWGAALSVALLYLILRIDIAGEPYLWKLGWLVDLVSNPEAALEGHAGDVTEVALLGAAWVRGILRGASDLTFESVLSDVSLGLVVMLPAAAFAERAGAPDALRWLPVPYMAAGLLALSLAHMRPVAAEGRRPFLRVWTLSTGGCLGVLAGVALLAGLFDPPSFETVGNALVLAVRGFAFAVAYVLWPLFFGMGWVMEHLIDWLRASEEFAPEPPETDPLMGVEEGEENGAPGWSRVLGYVFRSGLILLAIVLVLAVLWFAFRRFSRGREDGVDVREDVEPVEGGALGDLLSSLSGALGRLRWPGAGGARGRDAIGRLYFSMLRRATDRGLPRPPSATPHEFAPRLEEHFGSSLPGPISRAFAEARYGRRPPRREELEYLRSRWEEDSR